ncbi:MAG: carboxypeptidase-like regulatory domain-containing protein [Brevundimonas sp.]
MRRTSRWALALVATLVLGVVGALPASAEGGHTVTVKVTTAGGRGILDQSLTLSQDVDPYFYAYATTDASGVATFSDVPDGAYDLTGSFYGGSAQATIDQTITVGGADVSQTVKLAGVQAVVGKVTDKQSGSPIADVNVSLGAWDGGDYGYGTTRADGVYVAYVPAGTYRLTFEKYVSGSYVYTPSYYPGTPDYTKASKITVTAGQDKAGLNIALTKPGKVSGKATYAGKPIKSAYVEIANTNAYNSATTTSTGTFTTQVTAGSYAVKVQPDQTDSFLSTYFGGTVRKPDAKIIKVGAGASITGVNIAAKAGAIIKGVVKDSKGKPAKGVAVSGVNLTRAGWSYATTDAKGAYVLRGLATGKVQLTSDRSGAHAEATISAVQGKTVTAKTLVIKYPGTATIYGTIAVKSGALASASVSLLDSKKFGVDYAVPTKGKVTFSHLRAGTYTVVLDGANTVKKITVKSGQKVSFGKLTRGKQSVVKGYVRTPSGKAVANAWVWLVDSYGSNAGYATTNAKGVYSIKGLVKGKYTIQATPTSGTYTTGATTFTVLAGKGATKTVKVKTGGTIKGVVKNSKGKPVAGISVSAGGAFAETNAKGAYVLKGVAAGKTQVVIADQYVGGYHNALRTTTVKVGKTVTLTTVKVS